MDTLPSPMFCSKHSDCEAPISVIAKILSENDPIKFESISNEFAALGFTKVKDLAQTTFEKACSIKLSGDSSKLLLKALEMYDKHLDDLQTSAKLENKNGNFIRSQQICEELLQQKPNDLNVINLMAESFFKCGNYERSISFLRMAYNLNPNSARTLINIAFNYWKQSRYDLAKHYIIEAIQKSPCFNDTWIYYAELLVKTNDVEMAEYVYNQILSVYPDSYIIRNKYGKFLLSQKKIKNAKQQFKIAQKSAENFETLTNLGDVYFMTNKLEKAIINYNKALELNPNLKITLFNLGKVYFKITEYQKAIETFEKTIELDPGNASVLRYLAVAYCHQDDMVMSVQIYKRCLKLVPDDFEINLELALIYYQNLHDFQEAENCLKKCIQLNPQQENLYKNLIDVYKKLNKRIEASNTCMTLGDIYLKKSDLENAKNAFTTALYFNPENADGHWKLGLTMHKLGNFDLAILRYKKANEMTSRHCPS